MNRDEKDLTNLNYILDCIEKVERFMSYKRKKDYDIDLIEAGIVRYLQTMAETTQKISKHLKLSATDIPWHSLFGFRNVLVHDYLGIDMDEIYQTIKSDLPKLKKRVKKMIEFVEAKEKIS